MEYNLTKTLQNKNCLRIPVFRLLEGSQQLIPTDDVDWCGATGFSWSMPLEELWDPITLGACWAYIAFDDMLFEEPKHILMNHSDFVLSFLFKKWCLGEESAWSAQVLVLEIIKVLEVSKRRNSSLYWASLLKQNTEVKAQDWLLKSERVIYSYMFLTRKERIISGWYLRALLRTPHIRGADRLQFENLSSAHIYIKTPKRFYSL